ncbi:MULTISPECIES: hypothetical protein [unclassified Caballeronia]|nr:MULTISPECIES: hypothetical protein [unclassified Caballeronia]MDR5750046.1 hypothetical protein [Caballeronia sp. LZ024]MDR5842826.1 hypothetical protein [Caballeronia sp. LZ031]
MALERSGADFALWRRGLLGAMHTSFVPRTALWNALLPDIARQAS